MKLLKSRKALSTVATTLIILVVSVLLAGVVTLYAINVTTTRVQEEALFLTKPHLWVKNSSYYLGAILIINTGGRDVVIDKVTVRGQTVDWSNIFYVIFKGGISEDLIFIDNVGTGANTTLKNPSGGWLILQSVNGNEDLTLKSGYSMILYINSLDVAWMSKGSNKAPSRDRRGGSSIKYRASSGLKKPLTGWWHSPCF